LPILAALALAGLGSCHGPSRGSAPAGNCVNFDSQTLGTLASVGDSFVDQGVTVSVERFQGSNTTWTTSGHSRIDPAAQAGGSGHALNANNVNVRFGFGRIGGIRAKFGEYGGNVNLYVNADFRNVSNLADLNGQTVGGALVTVTGGTGNNLGTLTLGGIIEGFAIGGQELWLDDICATPAP
jgi:hypothetical protein